MAKRYEETWFKPTAGGYVFQAQNPWLLGPSRHYLVNEAQKAELVACLRRRLRVILPGAAIFMLIALGILMFAGSSADALGLSTWGFVALLAFTLVLLSAIVPHLYLMRLIRPLIARLQRTDERITFRDRHGGFANTVSGKLLLLGGIGGAMMVAGNIVTIVLSEDRVGSQLYLPAFNIVTGAFLMSYFVYLAVLKREQRKA